MCYSCDSVTRRCVWGGEKAVAIGKEVCMGRGEDAVELKMLHNPFHSTPQLRGSRDLVLRLADIQKPLMRESYMYKEKFVKLLLWEENEQRLALRMR